MNILMTGASGFIGQHLLQTLFNSELFDSMKVVAVTRNQHKMQKKFSQYPDLHWVESLDTFTHLDEFDAVINLAGEPIADKRWSQSQKSMISHSRWDVTERLASLIQVSALAPSVFISGSAVGFYGDCGEHSIDEAYLDGKETPKECFTHTVCSEWEARALKAQSEQTRVCLLRTGIVLGQGGGALNKMLLPYRMGLGGPIGDGKQYMPWIHMSDMVSAIYFLLTEPAAQGAYNCTAPNPVSNRVFSQTLAKVLHRPHVLFTPKWVLSLAMGEGASLLFDSINARPKQLLDLGFEFKFKELEDALNASIS
ncbi:TIGR01777 family oxidoreductase [Vibrio sp.]|nr:TIGR01777 family oxidoreductase [Vibrio sp.]